MVGTDRIARLDGARTGLSSGITGAVAGASNDEFSGGVSGPLTPETIRAFGGFT